MSEVSLETVRRRGPRRFGDLLLLSLEDWCESTRRRHDTVRAPSGAQSLAKLLMMPLPSMPTD